MIGHRCLGLLVTAVLTQAACTTRAQPNEAAPVAAQLSVESFLQAANRRDLDAMGRLFGTSDGPLIETGSTFGCAFKKIGSWFGGTPCRRREEVELRMEAIASVLRHEDYRIDREEGVAGRLGPATRVIVDLTVQGEEVPDVPFVVVRTSQGRWLVEQVDLQRAMARR
jgi:hypothetical protein